MSPPGSSSAYPVPQGPSTNFKFQFPPPISDNALAGPTDINGGRVSSLSSSSSSSSSSSGYGRVSPKTYSSAGQRRFSITQGFVVPSTDEHKTDMDNVDVVAIAQARTQLPQDQVSARFTLSLREETRLSPKEELRRPFKFDRANAWKALETKTAALGRVVPEEEAVLGHSSRGAGEIHAIEAREENARRAGHRRRQSIHEAAGSSGYGRVSPMHYNSPSQRRFSLCQGFVVP